MIVIMMIIIITVMILVITRTHTHTQNAQYVYKTNLSIPVTAAEWVEPATASSNLQEGAKDGSSDCNLARI